MAQGVERGRDDLSRLRATLPAKGCFYPPTLLTNVQPASTVARVEIFGPVAVAMSFRTPEEAVALANNTEYGLAASRLVGVDQPRARHRAEAEGGVVWVNSTNLFDACAGFGGYKESGYGREGGREGALAYTKPAWMKSAKKLAETLPPKPDIGLELRRRRHRPHGETLHRRQAGAAGRRLLARRRRRRTASSSAKSATATARTSATRSRRRARSSRSGRTTSEHNRAQILYYIAENLDARADEFADRLRLADAASRRAKTRLEVDAAVSRLFAFAAWADKYEGAVHKPPFRGLALAMNEPVGVVGIVAPEEPGLLAFVSLMGAAIAAGNAVVMVPSMAQALIATDLYQVLDTSDVPGGVVNIVTGDKRAARARTRQARCRRRDLVFRRGRGAAAIEKASAGNLKQTWCETVARDWGDPADRRRARHARSARRRSRTSGCHTGNNP